MAGERDAVQVEGLAALRKGLRGVDKDALKAVQAVTKTAAGIVAVEASRLAPRQTGALAASIKGTTSGNKGVVRSPLPYANVVNWGGTISPRGTPVTFKRADFIGRAMDAKGDEVQAALEQGFDALARRNGW